MAKKFFIMENKKIAGPVSPEQLRKMAADGRLRTNTRVSADRKNWVPASRVKGLVFKGKNTRKTTAAIGKFKKNKDRSSDSSIIYKSLQRSGLADAKAKAAESVSARKFQKDEGKQVIDFIQNLPFVKIFYISTGVLISIALLYFIVSMWGISSSDAAQRQWYKATGAMDEFPLPSLERDWVLVKFSDTPNTGFRRIAYRKAGKSFQISYTLSAVETAGMSPLIVELRLEGGSLPPRTVKYQKASEKVPLLSGKAAEKSVVQRTSQVRWKVSEDTGGLEGVKVSLKAYMNFVQKGRTRPTLVTRTETFVIGHGGTTFSDM